MGAPFVRSQRRGADANARAGSNVVACLVRSRPWGGFKASRNIGNADAIHLPNRQHQPHVKVVDQNTFCRRDGRPEVARSRRIRRVVELAGARGARKSLRKGRGRRGDAAGRGFTGLWC